MIDARRPEGSSNGGGGGDHLQALAPGATSSSSLSSQAAGAEAAPSPRKDDGGDGGSWDTPGGPPAGGSASSPPPVSGGGGGGGAVSAGVGGDDADRDESADVVWALRHEVGTRRGPRASRCRIRTNTKRWGDIPGTHSSAFFSEKKLLPLRRPNKKHPFDLFSTLGYNSS